MTSQRPGEDFDAFLRTGYEQALRLARRVVGDITEAEDVAAEASPAPTGIGPRSDSSNTGCRGSSGSPPTWRWTAPEQAAGVGVPPPVAMEGSIADDGLAVRIALVEALRRLPQRQRHAVALRYLGGLTLDEVAEALGMATGTVKSHLHRGVSNLRRSLGNNWEGDVA